MAKRLQVLLDEEEYQEIQEAAHAERMTVAEWARRALRRSKPIRPEVIQAKLRAIREAAQLNHPTADIDVMLEEIAAGRNARDIC